MVISIYRNNRTNMHKTTTLHIPHNQKPQRQIIQKNKQNKKKNTNTRRKNKRQRRNNNKTKSTKQRTKRKRTTKR